MIKKGLGIRSLLATGALAATALGSTAAHADQVLWTESLVFGSLASSTSFNVSGPGTVTVKLTDLDFTTSLASLSFSATTPTGLVPGSTWSSLTSGSGTSGTFSFNVGSAGLYSAIVSAAAGVGSPLNLGFFSMNASFVPATSAVPLPPGIWLLLSGLGGLGAAIRGRQPLVMLQPPAASAA